MKTVLLAFGLALPAFFATPASAVTVSCNNGSPNFCTCAGIPASSQTNSNGAADALNACILQTPNYAVLQLQAGWIYVDKQVQITHPMELTTIGRWAKINGNWQPDTTSCMGSTPASHIGQANPNDGQNYVGPCAGIYATNGSTMAWGGLLMVGALTGGTHCEGDDCNVQSVNPLSNAGLDHLMVYGNKENRWANNPTPPGDGHHQSEQWIHNFVNTSFELCTNCQFSFGINWDSLGGGFWNRFTDGFVLNQNSIAFHGDLNQPVTPRHGACFNIDGSGKGAVLLDNYVQQCTDTGFALNGAGNPKDANGNYLGWSFANALIQGNYFYAQGNQYAATMIHINTTGGSDLSNTIFTGTRVQNNIIDCVATAGTGKYPYVSGNAQCTAGIVVGASQYSGANPNVADSLLSGMNNNGLGIYSNTVTGASIPLLLQFFPLAQNMVYAPIGSDANANNFQPGIDNSNLFFLPMECKQWAISNPGQMAHTSCCNTGLNSTYTWYATPQSNFPSPNTGSTIAFNQAQMPVQSQPIVMSPFVANNVAVDWNTPNTLLSGPGVYQGYWIGAGPEGAGVCF